MANLVRRVRREKRSDIKVDVLPSGATVGSGWDAEAAPGTPQFRIYVHNPSGHYTVGMDAAEAEKIVRMLAGGLGFNLVKPEVEETNPCCKHCLNSDRCEAFGVCAETREPLQLEE